MSKDEFRPEARAGMLIRKPADAVFQAFIDPAVTSRFWFTGGSSVLRQGATVTWTWGMYGVSDQVSVTELVQNKRIAFTWGSAEGPSLVEWTLTEIPGKGTFVDIVNSGFGGSSDKRVAAALDSTGGFALVLAGAKAWLEHGIDRIWSEIVSRPSWESIYERSNNNRSDRFGGRQRCD